MSLAEWMVIIGVAVVAFGPKQLPLLATQLAKGILFLQKLQSELFVLWDTYQKEQTLKENEKKAQLAAEHPPHAQHPPVEKEPSP